MSGPYVGEIRIFGGNFAPVGWALCNGAQLSIGENETLFQLIGTTYGGDGVNTFNLPDLRSRTPIHMGTGGGGTYVIGQPGGVEQVTLTTAQIPSHNHFANATTAGQTQVPAANTLPASSTPTGRNVYGPYGAAPATLAASTIPPSGGNNQPHSNIQPFLAINFIISLFGIFPSPN